MVLYVGMPKRSSKRKPVEGNALTSVIVAEATGDQEPKENPAAVAVGRLSGLKGGAARAKKLSAKRRSEIAKKAAEAR